MKELAIITQNYKNVPVRMIQEEEEVWFVAKDICEVLGLRQTTNAIRSIPDDEKGVKTFNTPGGEQALNVINEPGLYRLTIRSTKPEAKPFQDWVVKEVLPSIRKTGSYSMNGDVDLVCMVRELGSMVKDLAGAVRDLIPNRKQELPAPSMNTRARLNEFVRDYARLMQVPHQDVWNRLYEQFYYTYGINLGIRARNANALSILDIAEKLGYMETLYSLALRVFPR